MRQTLLIYLLVLSCTAIAQTSSHELKTDLFLPSIFNTAHLAYEYSPNGRISFEAGMFFTWTHALLSIMPEAYDPSNPKHQLIEWNIENKNARQYFGIAQLSGRYYFSKKQNCTGLYGGVYLSKSFQIWREKTYDQLYEERNEVPVRVLEPYHFGLGVMAGYKFLFFKNSLLLEPNVGLDWDPRGRMYRDVNYRTDSRWYFIPTLKVGYRIN